MIIAYLISVSVTTNAIMANIREEKVDIFITNQVRHSVRDTLAREEELLIILNYGFPSYKTTERSKKKCKTGGNDNGNLCVSTTWAEFQTVAGDICVMFLVI